MKTRARKTEQAGFAVEERVQSLFSRAGMTLAVAESCTGGLIGHRITSVSGSSGHFLGGVIAYSNDVKIRILGVKPETLKRRGAVSREVAQQMARGVRARLGADIGLAVTGIAGPGGGTKKKPVGLVHIALAHGKGCQARRFMFKGDRLSIKSAAAESALKMLVKFGSLARPW